MKRLILASLLAVTLVVSSTSCSTSPTAAIVTSEAVVITSVDTGMKVWHDWVVAGKATQSQVDAVKKAYNYYYDAQQVAKAGLEMSLVSGTNTISATDIA